MNEDWYTTARAIEAMIGDPDPEPHKLQKPTAFKMKEYKHTE
jgi:hypothetical protein